MVLWSERGRKKCICFEVISRSKHELMFETGHTRIRISNEPEGFWSDWLCSWGVLHTRIIS